MARLAHVNIRTPRFDETVQYYRRVIGLTATRAETRPESTRHAWLREEDGRASIHIQHEDSREAGPAGGAAYHHIAFDCVDPQHWRERLASLGEPFTETAFPEAGLLQFNLTDPNGLKVELTFDVAA